MSVSETREQERRTIRLIPSSWHDTVICYPVTPLGARSPTADTCKQMSAARVWYAVTRPQSSCYATSLSLVDCVRQLYARSSNENTNTSASSVGSLTHHEARASARACYYYRLEAIRLAAPPPPPLQVNIL